MKDRLLHSDMSRSWKAASRNVSYGLAGAVKWMGYNANDDLNVMVVGNFDVKAVTSTIGFPKTGTWIDLKDNSTLSVNQNNISLTLQPGEYHVYLDRSLDQVTPTHSIHATKDLTATVSPNPASDFAAIQLILPTAEQVNLTIHNGQGQLVQAKSVYSLYAGEHRIALQSNLQPGIYFIKLFTHNRSRTLKFIKY